MTAAAYPRPLPRLRREFQTQLPLSTNLDTVKARPQITHQTPAHPAVSFEQVVELCSHTPPQTVVLGVCDDEAPVLFDLNDPQPGPLLVIGESGAGKTRLLQLMAFSGSRCNPPDSLRWALLANSREAWTNTVQQARRSGHCQTALAAGDPALPDLIFSLADTVEKRLMSPDPGPAILLLVDGLEQVRTWDADLQITFEWLLKTGPLARVWPVAAVTPAEAAGVGRWISKFRTRLIGKMAAPAANRYGMYPDSGAENLAAGQQFALWVQHSWLKFWLPVNN